MGGDGAAPAVMGSRSGMRAVTGMAHRKVAAVAALSAVRGVTADPTAAA